MNLSNDYAIIIAGVTGDLVKKKLMPALNTLYLHKKINQDISIIGIGRGNINVDDFRNMYDVDSNFKKHLFYNQNIKGLKNKIKSIKEYDRYIIFMALPPSVYGKYAEAFYNEGFKENTTLIIEKPFGYDYNSAKKLNSDLLKFYEEKKILRIDHYLAKDAVQNILIFRFANYIFHPIWNSRHIQSIHINSTEQRGVENRGGYFDNAGIIRDMIQNHLFQLLCLITMSPPVSLNSEDIRHKKIEVLKNLQVLETKRYQYNEYLNEKNIKDNSNTETFAEMKLRLNNFTWYETPIYIRSGKAVNRTGTEISINFKPLPKLLFNTKNHIKSNKIIFKIQPSAGILLDLASKLPGIDLQIKESRMKFCYKDIYEKELPDAYYRLLLDAINCNSTLFISSEETELSWKILEPFLDKGKLIKYKKGTLPKTNLNIEWTDFDKYSCG